ncbi:MAG: response regulator [Acidobacteriota bacterium]|nr:response regulator [Acidobacteriota bacterium]
MEKLLVLDDEILILKSLERLFEDEYEVFTTSDVETALREVRGRDIAVILCDERMPGTSGHEFLRRAREVSSATRVMMSGYADITALAKAVTSGQIFSYIAKPWDAQELKAQVGAAAVHFKLIQEVEQGRGLLRALMENSPDLIFFKDCDSRFTRVNRAQARSFEVQDAAECVGKSDLDYFEPADALRWREEELEILRSGRPQVDRIERFKKPQDGVCWMSTTKVPMFDRGGQVCGIAGISRDITALKTSEQLLREQSERNRMIIETASEAFIGMDADGTITAWNPQAELTFGWTASEAIGRTLWDTVVAPAYRAAHPNGVEQFLTTTEGSQLNRPIDLLVLHRDGHEFPVEATVWLLRSGGTVIYNAFVRDISKRLLAEEARRREISLAQLLQSVTMAANRSSSIEHTAKTCLGLICTYMGWPVCHVYLLANRAPGQMASTALWHLQDDARFAAFRKVTDNTAAAPGRGLPGRILSSGKPQWIVNLADETPLSERTRAAVEAGLHSGFGFPIVVDEQIIGILEFFSLYTVPPDEELLNMLEHIGSQLGQVIIRQRAEADLQRAKASAESANRAKSEFLTTMSHEMRTPMNAILGMADMLSESPLRAEQRDYVRVFQKAGANLLELINNLLDLSKVESGHVELEAIAFDLRVLLERVIEMMVSRASDQGLLLTLEVLPDVPSNLVGDPNRLRQILVNLIGNALKFTTQGSVTLRVEREPPPAGETEAPPAGETEALDWLRFAVIDTGIGIAADKIKMIFERFTQADSSTTRKYGGTGLGLAICKGLVELMGGRLDCSSELGQGSVFFLSAPFEVREQGTAPAADDSGSIVKLTTDPAERHPAERHPAERHPGYRILIAEDSEYNIVLIRAYLKNSGFELDVAENGKIAVEKVMAAQPDLVLMDLQMPVMDGLEATRAIRHWEATTGARPTPILALTAHAAGDGVGMSLEAGCNEHLTKPIKRVTLLEAISRHVHGSIRVTPPEDVGGLVPGYLAGVRREMGEILAGLDRNDCKIARRLGRQFEGSGDGYGFPEITRTGAAVALAATTANEDEIRRQILSLAAFLDRVEIVSAI